MQVEKNTARECKRTPFSCVPLYIWSFLLNLGWPGSTQNVKIAEKERLESTRPLDPWDLNPDIPVIRLDNLQWKAFSVGLNNASDSLTSQLLLSCDGTRKHLLLAVLQTIRRRQRRNRWSDCEPSGCCGDSFMLQEWQFYPNLMAFSHKKTTTTALKPFLGVIVFCFTPNWLYRTLA